MQDSYALSNHSMVDTLYPFAGSFSEIAEQLPTITANGEKVSSTLYPGGYSGRFTGIYGADDSDGSSNILQLNSWEGYKSLLESGSYQAGAFADYPTPSQHVAVYSFTDFRGLSPFEKEYVDEFLKYDERHASTKLEDMYQRHAIKASYFIEPWEQQSKMGLLFIGQSVPPQIKKSLKKYLTPIVVIYDVVEQLPIDSKSRFNIIGGSFAEDFHGVINLAKNIKLLLTKEKGMPSKDAIVN